MPICPKCRSEYREGFSTCADCDEALVPEPDMPQVDGGSRETDVPQTPPTPPRLSPVCVFTSTSIAEASAVANALEGSGIRVWVENEDSGMLAIGLPSLVVPIRVVVGLPDLDQARTILQEMGRAKARTRRVQVTDDVEKHPSWGKRQWAVALFLAVLVATLSFHPGNAASSVDTTWPAWLFLLMIVLIRLRDAWKEDPVPILLLFVFGTYGAAAAVGIAFLPTAVTTLVDNVQNPARFHYLFVAPVEETAKIIGVLIGVAMVPSWRRSPQAWILAGAASGAGFGLVENIGYAIVSDSAHPVDLFFGRSVALVHLSLTGALAYGASGFAREGNEGCAGLMVGWFGVVFVHGTWNAIVSQPVLKFPGISLLVLLPTLGILALFWHMVVPSPSRASEEPPAPESALDGEKSDG